jgi:CysZ protein
MMTAFFRALGDLLSPELRSVLWRALGLTLLLFIAVLVGVQMLLAVLTEFSWPWADVVLGLGTGLVLLVAFFFLMAPVTAAFAGLFLDEVAARVELRHYPADPPGTPLPAAAALFSGIRFAGLVLVVNLAMLPLVFTGIGAIALLLANAYLLSREFFEMAASRHMPLDEARRYRQENSPAVFMAGHVPAALALVPILNIAVPLFATAYFVHVFKLARASSA